MAQYIVEIDDEAIHKQIEAILNRSINNQLSSKYSETGKEVSAAVKELIYSRKDEIIEEVINRATAEVTRKAIPKLLERLRGGDFE